MVMDQTGGHIAGELVVPANMRVVLLPPYSHELNPAEHIWEVLREDCFAHNVFTDLDAVEDTLSSGLLAIESGPSRTQQLTGILWMISISLNAT